MNLTTEAWIPVVWYDGKPRTVSLREAFERGHEIQDLAVRPHERIALMRLLICITQAALRGPADYDEWNECHARIVPSARDYLRRWQLAFELFGDGQRFLQVGNLKRPARESGSGDEEANDTSKLDLALATGNNATVFDNTGGSERVFSPAELALMLLTFQCFSPGGRIGVALWDGEETPGRGSSHHAPCVAGRMLHGLLRSRDLVASVHGNLMTQRQAERLYGRGSWGKPVWEMMPQRLAHAEAVRNANRTYLGRLLPLARAIWLGEDGRSLILANGVRYESYDESGWREPTATVVVQTVKGTPKRVVLQASVDKGLWRELHALTVKAKSDQPGGPVALQQLSGEEPFDLWVGSLVADQAKPVDTVESVFHVPAQMLYEGSQKAYEEGVKYSDRSAQRLHRALSTYRMAIEGREKDVDAIGRRLRVLKGADRERLQQLAAKAQQQFWTDVELAVPLLLAVAERPARLGLDGGWHKTEWGKAVASAIHAAFQRACPHETPRQMRAYAFGLKVLFTQTAAKGAAEGDEEAEA
jgi:CRISPR system Cascade subunit CasA